MQIDPSYDDVVADVAAFLADRADACIAAGVDASSICVDPGIGFGKTTQHNLVLVDRLAELVAMGFPVMVGASRKRFLGEILGIEDPERRDAATAVLTAMAVDRGAMVFRVHDPRSSVEAARLAWAIVGGHAPSRPSGSQ
jgi:dihydropteroate synthase